MFNIPNNIKPSLSLDGNNNNMNGTQENQSQNIPQQSVQQNQYEHFQQPSQQQNSCSNNYNNTGNCGNTNNANIINRNNTSGQGVILAKGQKVSLFKLNPNLDEVDVCLGWDVSNSAYDLDSEAFILGANEKVLGDEWFVFYNHLCSPDGAVRHSGDNTTGQGLGDDEIISIKLSQLNSQVEKIIFVVTINEAKERNLDFSGVSNAFIRVVDKKQNRELVRFNLTDYYSEVTSMMVGELYKKDNEWRFNPIGNGTNDDLIGLCYRYGVNVAG